VKEPRRDDERLSALLAGRLEGPERDELLAYLSTADEDLEVFAHTAAILREMDEEDAQDEGANITAASPPGREVPVPSMTRSTRGRPRKTPRWAILTAIAGLVLLWTLTWPPGGTPGVSPMQSAMNIEFAGPALPFDASRPYEGIPGGDDTRGEGNSGWTKESAAQAGAFLVRLSLAIEARDSAATATLARQVQERFDRQGGSALRKIAARAGAPAAELQPLLAEETERLEKRPDARYLRVGAWAEAARLAANQRDVAYFRSGDSADMIRLAERVTKDDPRARAALSAVQRELDAEREPNSTTLETHLIALLEAIAT
jgi:hypothetical protein